MSDKQPAAFIKWAGSKRKITDTLISYMPGEYNDYWEPFLGGGSLFFALSPLCGHNAFLSDQNEELILAYKAVRHRRPSLVSLLDNHQAQHSEEYFYQVRAQHLSGSVERAARFIYLNKTAYNGLWRVNSKNEMNAPWNHADRVRLYDADNLLACSKALRFAEIRCCSFDEIEPASGDFVYLDPPYDGTYNGYAKDGFGRVGQERLAAFCRELDRGGVHFLLSNNGTDLIRSLYAGFEFATITAPRFISCKKDGRKPVEEVLVFNYERDKLRIPESITGATCECRR